MIRCEVIKEFTLDEFDKLKNIKRRRIDTYGKLYDGDTFECDNNMYDYLNGGNDKGKVVVKLLEVIPEIGVLSQSPIEELEKEMNKEAKITTTNYKKTNKKARKK